MVGESGVIPRSEAIPRSEKYEQEGTVDEICACARHNVDMVTMLRTLPARFDYSVVHS